MPRNGERVVCTLCDTIATLLPTSAFTRVDLPTFGAPIRAIKLQRHVSSAPQKASCPRAERASGGSGGGLGSGSMRRNLLPWRGGCFISPIDAIEFDPGMAEHRCCGRLLGSALGTAEAFRRHQVRQFHHDAKLGIMIRAG